MIVLEKQFDDSTSNSITNYIKDCVQYTNNQFNKKVYKQYIQTLLNKEHKIISDYFYDSSNPAYVNNHVVGTLKDFYNSIKIIGHGVDERLDSNDNVYYRCTIQINIDDDFTDKRYGFIYDSIMDDYKNMLIDCIESGNSLISDVIIDNNKQNGNKYHFSIRYSKKADKSVSSILCKNLLSDVNGTFDLLTSAFYEDDETFKKQGFVFKKVVRTNIKDELNKLRKILCNTIKSLSVYKESNIPKHELVYTDAFYEDFGEYYKEISGTDFENYMFYLYDCVHGFCINLYNKNICDNIEVNNVKNKLNGVLSQIFDYFIEIICYSDMYGSDNTEDYDYFGDDTDSIDDYDDFGGIDNTDDDLF